MKDVMATSDVIRYRVYEVRSLVCGTLELPCLPQMENYFLFSPLAAGGGNLIRVSHLSRLLCQQQLHLSAAGGTDGRRRIDQVVINPYTDGEESPVCCDFLLTLCLQGYSH